MFPNNTEFILYLIFIKVTDTDSDGASRFKKRKKNVAFFQTATFKGTCTTCQPFQTNNQLKRKVNRIPVSIFIERALSVLFFLFLIHHIHKTN